MNQSFSVIQISILAIILLINLYTFCLFYIDKQRAIKHKYRISEKHLLMASFLLGGIGSWLSMGAFRHKTQKNVFKFLIPVAAVLTLVVIFSVLLYLP